MNTTLELGTAVVTGAGSPLGRAIALALARDGCKNLAIGYHIPWELEETTRLLREQYQTLNLLINKVDVTNEASTAAFFQYVVDKFGRIDYAVNLTSHEPPLASAHEVQEADFDRAFEENQKALFFCSKAILGHMIKQEFLAGYDIRGSVVNVASIAATAALPGTHVFSATMGGVLGLSKSDAYDYAQDKIRVNMVAPLMSSDENTLAALETHPFGRYTSPEDVANAVSFLVGPQAAFISGITLPVDGGFHLKTGGPPR